MFFEWKVDCNNDERGDFSSQYYAYTLFDTNCTSQKKGTLGTNKYILITNYTYSIYNNICEYPYNLYYNIVLICKSTDLFDFGPVTTRTDDLCAHKREILLYTVARTAATVVGGCKMCTIK